ncbi:hypothetical protein XarbCFBP8132_19085 [Xanthomonas arboricola]|nr:hypothetical protein XarbCFBP8132_19085 [Xanthomonas arboricola]
MDARRRYGATGGASMQAGTGGQAAASCTTMACRNPRPATWLLPRWLPGSKSAAWLSIIGTLPQGTRAGVPQ